MNFYKHHIGDYQKKTAMLSITEHGAYLLMLQHFYATEDPLPTGARLYRLLRADTKIERAAVDVVVARFWTETETGLVNGRASEEISKVTHQGEINLANGKRGGRPKKTESVSETITEPQTGAKPNGNPQQKALQTPDSRLQDKNQARPDHPRSEDPPPTATAAGTLSRAMREKNVLSQPSEPRLIALAEAGVTPEQIAQACDAARDAKGPNVRIAPAYVYAIAERWITEPASAPPQSPESVAAGALRLLEERERQESQRAEA